MFLKEILTVTELGIFKGDKKGNLRTKGTFTRAEMEQIIKNAFPYSVKAPH
ncbi:S-layer domain protein [Bacillus thuringiensis IBL 200]|nr:MULTISPECIES: S-layer homology domain-containing protein [Bacillus cereus group]ACK98007.1 S-layer domain protein [Bacillus cereus G9842]EEM92461.1 S-layer domain protein [Bacillus thuringiensis IBL 200]KXY69524.1 S-layer protein [Bacillus cereus]OUB34663.1 S-layer protein [Bacillus thuringiensis serovar palmanyolensis]MBJ7939293.1 S-layer homology domain-containing protein [Bacillus cereus]